MPRIEIKGVGLAYDLIGTGEKIIVITPGGRASKDSPGLRTLAAAVSAAGLTAMIWDRPNCGEADICFSGDNEAELCAELLSGLIDALGLPPVTLAGASGGARVSLFTAVKHPGRVAALFLWWITGGAAGLASLIHHTYGESVAAAATGNMDAVLKLPAWKEALERNPGNRARLLELSPQAFIQKMQQWGWACFPTDGSPIPGLTRHDLGGIHVPAAIVRNGKHDPYHLPEASEQLARVVPGATLLNAPWGDDEFIERLRNVAKDGGLFTRSDLLAPPIADFVRNHTYSARTPDTNRT